MSMQKAASICARLWCRDRLAEAEPPAAHHSSHTTSSSEQIPVVLKEPLLVLVSDFEPDSQRLSSIW